MKTWGFGVIGCGNIGTFHVASIKDIANAALIGVTSRQLEKARKMGEQEQCYFTDDYKQLLARTDVDIVCITTSSGSHASIGLEALEAGKHIIVEKPLAMKVDDAESLIRAAERLGLKIGVISQKRFEEPSMRMKKAMEANDIGTLLLAEVQTPFYRSQAYYDSASWRGTLEHDGGALMNQGIHQIDLMLWMAGKVKSVKGKTATQAHQMEAEDIGLAIVEFESGSLGTIMSSTNIVPGFPHSIRLCGTKGTLLLQDGVLTHWDEGGSPAILAGQAAKSSGGSRNPLDFSHHYHRAQIEDFIHALEENRSPAVTGEDGRDAVRLVHAIYSSSRTGETVYL